MFWFKHKGSEGRQVAFFRLNGHGRPEEVPFLLVWSWRKGRKKGGISMTSARLEKRGEPRDWGLAPLTILALGLGIGTGFGAVLFRDLIGLLHNLCFYGLVVV